MNDFIAKPIDPETMYATLNKWIKSIRSSSTNAIPVDDHLKDKESFISELDGVDVQKGLKTVNGDQNLYRKILWKFRENQSGAVSQLSDALAEGDMELGERLTHSLKSVAATIGAVSVSDSAGNLEIAIKKGGEVDQSLIDKLNETHTKVIKSLQHYFGTDVRQEETNVSLDPVMAMSLIRKIRERLEDYDSSAVNLMDELKAALPESIVSKQVKVLQSYMDAYDFDAALKVLQQVEKIIEDISKT
ncbi:MAG: Hpt domain-containing protein, partial [Mariprofundaceae bacterium]